MRSMLRSALLALTAIVLAATDAHAAEGGLLTPSGGLMVWTLAIFIVLLFVLSKFAFGPITAAVERRERMLEEAIAEAKRDREEAARLLAEHRAQLEAGRTEVQKLIGEGRTAGERVRAQMLEETKAQQAELLARAQREIGQERDRAIADLRREAVDLALAGASKVIERNLDDAANRALVESYLASIKTVPQAAR
jgi:F-type H+-transporting ATPase subunit b